MNDINDVKFDDNQRKKVIVKTSITGIIVNIFLAGFKAVVGLISNSIAVILDAVNNLSDALSSVITIIGTKLAGKPADKKHPFGYGRIEYLSAMIISVIVLYAGITSFTESAKKIIEPKVPDYSIASLIIIFVAVFAKIILGRYFVGVGKKVNSDSLVNSGKDATMDSVISASTLVAAIIYTFFGVSLEAYLGAIISVIIIKSGLEMLKETLSEILGESADVTLIDEVKKTICSYDNVYGAYDLVLNNYGPDVFSGSVHIEVPDYYTAEQIDDLTRSIIVNVYKTHKIILNSVGVYSVNTTDEEIINIKNNVKNAVFSEKYVTEMHAFYVNKDRKTVRFDLVISFDSDDRKQTLDNAKKKAEELYPDYKFIVVMDTDFVNR